MLQILLPSGGNEWMRPMCFVLQCKQQNARVDESLFPHTYNPNLTLVSPEACSHQKKCAPKNMLMHQERWLLGQQMIKVILQAKWKQQFEYSLKCSQLELCLVRCESEVGTSWQQELGCFRWGGEVAEMKCLFSWWGDRWKLKAQLSVWSTKAIKLGRFCHSSCHHRRRGSHAPCPV